MVNGEPITNYDIEQRSKLVFLTTHKPASREQVVEDAAVSGPARRTGLARVPRPGPPSLVPVVAKPQVSGR